MARGSFTQPRSAIQAKASEAATNSNPDAEPEKPGETGREIPDFLKPHPHGERTPGAEPRGRCWPYW
jgi:hypothetical protein